MRDPARIPELCELLQRAWQCSPDLRLGQLVVNAVRPKTPCPAVFYAEDGAMRRGLDTLAREGVTPLELPTMSDAALEWKAVGEPAATTVTFDGARVASFEVDSLLCEVLELRMGGEYREGSQGNPDAAAMALHVATVMARTEPDVVLLDLSALRYRWGNSILRIFDVIARFDTEYPVGVVVLGGPDSAPALGSLGVVVHTEGAAALEDAKAEALRRSMDIG